MHNIAMSLPGSPVFSLSPDTHNGITIHAPILSVLLVCRGSLVPRLRPRQEPGNEPKPYCTCARFTSMIAWQPLSQHITKHMDLQTRRCFGRYKALVMLLKLLRKTQSTSIACTSADMDLKTRSCFGRHTKHLYCMHFSGHGS